MSNRDSAPTKAQAAAAYREAQRRIAHANRPRVRVLDLSDLGLTSVPPEIGSLSKITTLRLNRNELTSVPPEVGQLAQLASLQVYGNQLTSIPPEIGRLAQLTELLLNYNRLRGLPSEIGQLTQLTSLYLHKNELTRVPAEIGQLTQLTEFFLWSNQLTSLPPEIGQLAQLTQLGLEDNQLQSVPPEIGQLARLNFLTIDNNQLTSVPSEIGQLAELTQLYLNGNQLSSLPESLRRLSKLKVLCLHDNPKLNLPASVLGTHPTAPRNSDQHTAPDPGPILDYYFRTLSTAERQPLCEGKLILVGRGDVGKTSLVRRLVDNTFSRQEDTTQGIRIRQWPINVGRKREWIRLHVWDFGGQEIMHATHQLFLTDRSLYLLVLDGRAGQQEAEADYWLRLIASFAPDSPVLVVLNKIKKDHFTLNRGAIQQKFPQVQGFVETDCDHPGPDQQPGQDGYGIAELHTAIAQQVDQLPEIRQAFPASWFAIKEQLSQTEQNFLSLDEYRKLCEQHGEPNSESQMHLSLFLHRLGIALNFSDDPRLHDKHVLNPHWLTTGIYSLLTSNRLAARRGELRPEDLANELPVEKYPPAMHPFLIHLMEKFELCFSFEEPTRSGVAPQHRLLAARYLIPELLDPQQPDAATEFDQAQCLNFHYLYPVLPPGLLPRFIVRTHVLSEEHRWKTGVILNFEGNTALVKADAQEKTIRILINGPAPSRRRMLAMIRQDFDVIHSDTPHLKPDELVSFPQHPQLTVRYAKLEVLFRHDPNKSIDDVVDEQVVSATVRELLEGVELAPIVAATARAASRRRDEKRSHSGLFAEEAEPLKVFYSYAHADAKQRLRLSKHLSILERIGLIRGWYDNEILPGDDFEKEIADKLGEADIVLLLISPDFVASKYCYEIELQMAMERHAKEEVRVLPIIIRPTPNAWKKLPAGKLLLGSLNALPTSGKPIPDWPTHDAGWANVAEGVERAAETLRKRMSPK